MYYLSLVDLVQVEGFSEAFGKQDKEKIEEILYQNGLDVNEYYTEEVVLHRPLTSKDPVKCLRYLGKERCNKSWINTGAASLEAYVESSMDDTLKHEMKNMSREGYSDLQKSREEDYQE